MLLAGQRYDDITGGVMAVEVMVGGSSMVIGV